jgi:hypothetical protein
MGCEKETGIEKSNALKGARKPDGCTSAQLLVGLSAEASTVLQVARQVTWG